MTNLTKISNARVMKTGPGRPEMKGIQFVVDEAGQKKAVIIDLAQWGELWEDIYDVMVCQSRDDEPTVEWEELKAEMKRGKE